MSGRVSVNPFRRFERWQKAKKKWPTRKKGFKLFVGKKELLRCAHAPKREREREYGEMWLLLI